MRNDLFTESLGRLYGTQSSRNIRSEHAALGPGICSLFLTDTPKPLENPWGGTPRMLHVGPAGTCLSWWCSRISTNSSFDYLCSIYPFSLSSVPELGTCFLHILNQFSSLDSSLDLSWEGLCFLFWEIISFGTTWCKIIQSIPERPVHLPVSPWGISGSRKNTLFQTKAVLRRY